jgi:hypothetical protein
VTVRVLCLAYFSGFLLHLFPFKGAARTSERGPRRAPCHSFRLVLLFPSPEPRCPDPCLYTQPRSFIAVATRSIATMYAALRMYTFFFTDMSRTAWKATVILSSRRLTTSSFDQ